MTTQTSKAQAHTTHNMDSRSSSSSSRLSDSETDVSTFSTPSSSTTSFDSIVTATYHAVSSTPNLHYSHDSTKYSPRSDISCDLSQTAFDQAYQLYAQTSHMGILDPAYTVFNSEHGYGSLVYKIQARTIIVTGDPLCSEQNLRPLLDELDHFRASRNLALVFVSMSEDFVKHCEKDWDTIQFGCDRVLNPLANKILQGKGNKRMISQNKQLLDPKRGNLKVRLYSPSVTGIDIKLQNQIQALYDDWRYERNKCHKGNSQAFITVYDLFSHPDLTAFLYVSDSKNTIKGFATLRALGGHHGFHLDPCIASPDAPRGVTDLLVVSAMQLLSTAGINYMSLGFEPLDGVQMMNSERKLHSWVWKHSYDRVMKSSTLSGKAAYFKKFYPDDSLASKLFICIPKKRIPVRESLALLKYANIDIKQVLTKRTST